MSLRLRLLFLVLLVVLPAAALLVYTAADQGRVASEDARVSAVRLAALASSGQQQIIDMTRQFLAAIATLPDVRPGHSSRCSELMANLLTKYPSYANLGATTREGDVFCSAVPAAQPTNIAHRDYYAHALATRDFVVSDYVVGRITGKPVVIFVYPVLDERGEVSAMIFASFDLTWLGRLVTEASMPARSTVTIVDRKGLVLARYPGSEGIGMPAEPALPRLVSVGSDVQTAEAPGPDGSAYLYAFSALGHAGQPVAFVSVGVSKAVAFARADRLLRRTLLALGAVAALMLAIAWVGGDLVIVRRVRALVGATQKLSAGDFGARSGLGHGNDELARLARAFDGMAESLQFAEEYRRREEELARRNYALEQENKAIQEANRMKSDFVSMVSHELRTPLTSIEGYVELLLDRARLSDEARESLETVKRSADRLLALINELLDLSRIEAGKVELHRSPVDLGAAIRAVAASLRPLLESKRQRLTLDVDPALPPVWADADRVAQILTNLVGNAQKYTPPGGAIAIEARRSDGLVDVRVRDTGVGLTAEEQARLFTPFYRAHREGMPRAVGTGLGLAITRLLVELHGGHVAVSSGPGQGSTFSFGLPIAGG